MNRTERAKKKKLRGWQNEARNSRNEYIKNLSYVEDGCGINATTFHDHQAQLTKKKKWIKKLLKEEKIAVINSRKEQIGA